LKITKLDMWNFLETYGIIANFAKWKLTWLDGFVCHMANDMGLTVYGS